MENSLDPKQFTYLIPFLSPILVTLLKSLCPLMNTDKYRKWLPYVCLLIGVGLTYAMNYFLNTTTDPFITGAISGTLGIGVRELTTNAIRAISNKSADTSTPDQP